MRELFYISTEETKFNDKTYKISSFIDAYSYRVFFGTDIKDIDKLPKGCKCLCDLDYKYDNKINNFKFIVTKAIECQ